MSYNLARTYKFVNVIDNRSKLRTAVKEIKLAGPARSAGSR